MIVQFDHIALTGTAMDTQTRILELMGYEQVFSSEQVPNPEIKRPFMQVWCDHHTLALYRREGSIPIEIIGYEHTSRGHSRYDLKQVPNGRLTQADEDDTAPDSVDALDTVVLETVSPSATCEFFRTLGLEQSDPRTLTFESPLTDPTFVELREASSASGETYLDTPGYPCLAFVTTDIEAELARLDKAGYDVTAVETIALPEKTLEIGFVMGPTGEPVELVFPHK
jgi:membrane-bound inhibitor of C-type lysozyme